MFSNRYVVLSAGVTLSAVLGLSTAFSEKAQEFVTQLPQQYKYLNDTLPVQNIRQNLDYYERSVSDTNPCPLTIAKDFREITVGAQKDQTPDDPAPDDPESPPRKTIDNGIKFLSLNLCDQDFLKKPGTLDV